MSDFLHWLHRGATQGFTAYEADMIGFAMFFVVAVVWLIIHALGRWKGK